MILQKQGFIYAGETLNKRTKDCVFLLIGILGALINLSTYLFIFSRFYFVIGSSLLLISAIYFNLFFFIALEMIIIAGHGACFLGIGRPLEITLPAMLCLQLFFFYYFLGRLKDPVLIIGLIGMILLSLSFAFPKPWIAFLGSASIGFYACKSAFKRPISLLWAITNSLFAIIALVKIVTP